MINRIKKSFLILLLLPLIFSCNHEQELSVSSPDGRITILLHLNEQGELFYEASFDSLPVLKNSQLGLKREDADFTRELEISTASRPQSLMDEYVLIHGKKAKSRYQATRRVFKFKNNTNEFLELIFQVSNDGFVFRYSFPEESEDVKRIVREVSSFNFSSEAHAWIQPRAQSKTGWNQVNPSYEEHYWQDTLLSSMTPNDSGWIFPALIRTPDCWVNLTEAWPNRNYCGSHLNKGSQPNELLIVFPEASEGFTGKEVYPESTLPWKTPWRIVTLGNLKTIAESTLGTDVAEPSVLSDISYIKPGRSSWSWALMKDPSVNYQTQVEFINYAAKMGWEYCLIDVGWDTEIGWNKIRDLSALASAKNVGLILWYNSAGNWNTVPYHPKDILLTTESRQKEFAKLQELGIKGIKVDFFGGDGQSMMAYYQDILEDAHKYQLIVNCHGATLPRGLHRTYPNLVSMESVRGFEYATFGQETADKVPTKATILPYTRNLFDPMDFTPVCFNDYDNNTRITGNAAELAQAILFLSGVQHYAETPRGMAKVPEYVRKLMTEIPVNWDETYFIEGYPGKSIVLARKKADIWYIAGINAEESVLKLDISLEFTKAREVHLISEGETLRSFHQKTLIPDENNSVSLTVKSNGGFVIRAEELRK